MAGRGSTLPLACSVLRRASWAEARSRTSRTQHAWVQQAGIEQDGVERARVEQAFSVCVRTAHAHLHADALGRTESCCLAARLGVPTPVESCQIVGQGCQGKFDSHVRQTSGSELTHPALLFQDSQNRFHDRLAPAVYRSSCWAAQFLPHTVCGLRMRLRPMPAARCPVFNSRARFESGT
jgi:hypothetical protein